MGSAYHRPGQVGIDPVPDREASCRTGPTPPDAPGEAERSRSVAAHPPGRSATGPVAPAPSRQVRVDLGCGRVKLPGFIGVDRYPLPGVDVVADLDRPLPFADDSVDLILASHSLEHVHDLSQVIREIYRICKHHAQVCIIAPYFQQGLNFANPYHKHAFNEHTPRFWTASAATPIDPADYYHPHAASWGLLESDNSPADIDLRCVKMEFFYFPAYYDLDADLRRRHRKQGFDVCDQIVYHLLVLKQPTPDSEFNAMTETMELFESPYIQVRRLRDRCDRLEADNCELSRYNAELAAQAHRCGRLEADNRELSRSNAELAAGAHQSREEEARLRRDLEDLARAVSSLEAALEEERRRLASVTGGTGWIVLDAIHRAGRVIAPPGTWRGRLVGAISALPRRALRRGIHSLVRASNALP
jgi:SAM-dependent methyltransferase